MNPQDPIEPNQPPQPTQPSQPGPAQQQWPSQPPLQTPPSALGQQPGALPSTPTEATSQPTDPQSPYGFIMQDAKPHQVSKFGLGGKAGKLLALVIAVAVVVIIIGVIVSSLSPKSTAEKLYVAVAQDQQELVRVASLGVSASNEDSKALALNTQVGISSDQKALTSYLAKSGIKLDAKQLALKKDSSTDTALNNAKATNTFDSALSNALIADLKSYRTDIQAAYKETTGKEAKQMLNDDYTHAQLLLQQAGVDTGTATSASN